MTYSLCFRIVFYQLTIPCAWATEAEFSLIAEKCAQYSQICTVENHKKKGNDGAADIVIRLLPTYPGGPR